MKWSNSKTPLYCRKTTYILLFLVSCYVISGYDLTKLLKGFSGLFEVLKSDFIIFFSDLYVEVKLFYFDYNRVQKWRNLGGISKPTSYLSETAFMYTYISCNEFSFVNCLNAMFFRRSNKKRKKHNIGMSGFLRRCVTVHIYILSRNWVERNLICKNH